MLAGGPPEGVPWVYFHGNRCPQQWWITDSSLLKHNCSIVWVTALKLLILRLQCILHLFSPVIFFVLYWSVLCWSPLKSCGFHLIFTGFSSAPQKFGHQALGFFTSCSDSVIFLCPCTPPIGKLWLVFESLPCSLISWGTGAETHSNGIPCLLNYKVLKRGL